jgi:hypothetical protein
MSASGSICPRGACARPRAIVRAPTSPTDSIRGDVEHAGDRRIASRCPCKKFRCTQRERLPAATSRGGRARCRPSPRCRGAPRATKSAMNLNCRESLMFRKCLPDFAGRNAPTLPPHVSHSRVLPRSSSRRTGSSAAPLSEIRTQLGVVPRAGAFVLGILTNVKRALLIGCKP